MDAAALHRPLLHLPVPQRTPVRIADRLVPPGEEGQGAGAGAEVAALCAPEAHTRLSSHCRVPESASGGSRTEWLVSPAGDVQTLVLQESIRIAMATRLWEFREAAASAHDYKKLLQVLFLPVRGPRTHPRHSRPSDGQT